MIKYLGSFSIYIMSSTSHKDRWQKFFPVVFIGLLSLALSWPQFGEKSSDQETPEGVIDDTGIQSELSEEQPVFQEMPTPPVEINETNGASTSAAEDNPDSPSEERRQSNEELERQIQEVVRLNEALKAKHAQQVMEVQRIHDQARAHQQIFKDLSILRNAAVPAAGAPNTKYGNVPRIPSVPYVPVVPSNPALKVDGESSQESE